MEAFDKNVPLPGARTSTSRSPDADLEDIFSISGRGTVVTGRIERGKVQGG